MTSLRFKLACGGAAVVSLLTVLIVWNSPGSSLQPLHVRFVGYTNSFGVPRDEAVFVISNSYHRPLKTWASAFVESVSNTNGRDGWVWVGGPKDSYLAPHQSLLSRIPKPDIVGEWRLLIPWSYGYRARVAEALRGHQFIPSSLRTSGERHASSGWITVCEDDRVVELTPQEYVDYLRESGFTGEISTYIQTFGQPDAGND